jgi:transposase
MQRFAWRIWFPAIIFYRQVEAKLDLSFVRELVRSAYAPRLGRPSIDSVVYFKLQLIMFFEGFRSERQLMEQVTVNLAHRWYLGYDLDEAVPDHSSLSRIRDRLGLEVFQRFFEAIVERCCAAGLAWGKELYFDGTRVRANADVDKQVPRFFAATQQ